MNSIDSSWFKALKYFADNTRAKITAEREEDEEYYREILPEDLEKTFIEFDYLNFKNNTKHIITQSGLQQLRDLENAQKRDWSFWISGTALALSILNFAITKGWIKI